MGCYSTCFPKPNKPNKSLLRPATTIPRLDQLLKVDESAEALPLVDAIPHSEDLQGVKLHISPRKKVTFDLNVKTYEASPAVEDEPDEQGDDSFKETKEEEDKSKCHSDSSSSSSLFSFPPEGYRYHNCGSDDEFDQTVSDDESDLDPYLADDDEDDGYEGDEAVKAESPESLFSLSIDSRKHKIAAERGDKEVNSPAPVKDLGSVLNPVENVSQWKVIKARANTLASQNNKLAKENRNSSRPSNIPVAEEPILKTPVGASRRRANAAVDTSLSSWLVPVDTSSASVGNSPRSDISSRSSPRRDFEDRPILGALTVDDIKELSAAASTPRRSRSSRSPEDQAIIGTVGSYWSHAGTAAAAAAQGRKLLANSDSSTAAAFEKRLDCVLFI